jgi:hypothetical protein
LYDAWRLTVREQTEGEKKEACTEKSRHYRHLCLKRSRSRQKYASAAVFNRADIPFELPLFRNTCNLLLAFEPYKNAISSRNIFLTLLIEDKKGVMIQDDKRVQTSQPDVA